MDDRKLVAQAAAGDADRKREIFEICAGLVFSICLRYADGDRTDAEDLTQTTFMKAFENIDSFKEPYNLKAWIARMAHNQGIDHARKTAAGHRVFQEFFYIGEQKPTGGQKAILEQRLGILEEALAAEPDDDVRETARLFYERELDTSAISQRLGVSVSVVTTRLLRFRARMRKRMVRLMLEDGQ